MNASLYHLRAFSSLLITVMATHAHGQAGSLDATFDVDGRVRTDIDMRNDKAFAVVIAADGRIITAGSTNDAGGADVLLVRYNSDGSMDGSFGSNGVARTSFGAFNFGVAHAIAALPDGKLLVVGSRAVEVGADDFCVLRYFTDGSIDSTFADTGMAVTSFGVTSDVANAMALQVDGKIVVGGSALVGFALARYLPQGTLDTSFDGDGKTTTMIGGNGSVVHAVAVQTDGRIIAAGSTNNSGRDLALARYQLSGELDTTFAGTGVVVNSLSVYADEATAVAVQPDGRILVAGYAHISVDQFALLRYNTDGSLDTTFGEGGITIMPAGPGASIARSMVLMPDSTILLAGSFQNYLDEDFALVKYNSDGSVHAGFGTNGIVITTFDDRDDFANAATLQPDGKIVVAGYSMDSVRDVAVARYLNSPDVGIIDLALQNNTVLIYPNPIEEHATLSYDLLKPAEITIELLDPLGRHVASILDPTNLPSGQYFFDIEMPPGLASGTYCVVISSPTGNRTVRVVKEAR